MPRLRSRPFATPDEVRRFPHGYGQILRLDESAIGRAVYEPGWRWTTDMPGIAGTATCQLHHLGYSISGTMHVALDDGQEIEITPESVYEIPAGHDAWVVGDAPWVTVEWTSARTFGVAPEGPGERVLATVLFTDIVDSTVTLERIGDAAWHELLTAHNRVLRDELNAFRGREITTTGDGFLAVFDGATRAVRCGAAMTRAVGQQGLAIRVGIHTGEVEFVGTDARGLAVHAAARVMTFAGPGEVVVSSTTNDLLEGSGLILEDVGNRTLKGLAGERRLFRLVA
ncbi:MAG TPA: adenylate/guanylate cyclase domain-containing protein [Methylomirabilota bacterium]|nr:adenylate/guanylate cyclase domain-containing protein [Methylomirabilota bacterium]